MGRIAMLWMDHAVSSSAGCSACLELAKLASVAVDFPKSGVPAVIPDELIIRSNVPRAHWRERKGSPSFHCEGTVGQLYDRIVSEMKSQRHLPRSDCTAMAGRCRDRNGSILYHGDKNRLAKSKEDIYDPVLVKRLGWKGDEFDKQLLDYAEYQRDSYESNLLELMNQYKIKSEGEVATGCILKYHKLHKRRRHDVSEDVRRQFRSIRHTFRSDFFKAVNNLLNGNLPDDEDEIEDDESEEDLDWVEAAATGMPLHGVGEEMTCEGKVREAKLFSRRLAAAYYITTYSPEMHAAGSRYVLYSFPWVVASDVIAHGVGEDSDRFT